MYVDLLSTESKYNPNTDIKETVFLTTIVFIKYKTKILTQRQNFIPKSRSKLSKEFNLPCRTYPTVDLGNRAAIYLKRIFQYQRKRN